MTCRGGDRARCDEADWARRGMEHVAAQRGMAAPPRGGLGRADGVVSRDERSEELGISVGCCSVYGVDRRESVDGLVRRGCCGGASAE